MASFITAQHNAATSYNNLLNRNRQTQEEDSGPIRQRTPQHQRPWGGKPCTRTFVDRSPRTPSDIFTREGIFNSFGTSRVTSHTLTVEELGKFSRVLGYMPRVTHLGLQAPMEKINDHLNLLDKTLRERVQAICDRLHERQARMRCLGSCAGSFASLVRMIRPGVVREIWPEVVFYLIYSFAVAWYAGTQDYDISYTATMQDTIYYPALVMSFILSFRASDCMARYQQGCQCAFQMEKQLRDVAFEVMTKLSLEEADMSPEEASVISAKKRYFKHEFRRLAQVLFMCAARDLNDSACTDGEEEQLDETAARLTCSLTDVEHAAIHVTHSAHGHVFRVFLASSWLYKLVNQAQDDGLFDEADVSRKVFSILRDFKEHWMKARQVAYTSMPDSLIHILWVLAHMMNIVLPWEYVTVDHWLTWIPSLFISISFFGTMRIADNMENPFGFDDDDIPIWEVSEFLDEEIALIMFYAALDEVGGENLYRGMTTQDHIYIN